MHCITLSPRFTDCLECDTGLHNIVEDGGQNQEYFNPDTSETSKLLKEFMEVDNKKVDKATIPRGLQTTWTVHVSIV